MAGFVGKHNWTDENSMFRPESLMFEDPGNSECHRMKVRTVQYSGNGYDLLLEEGGTKWHAFAPEKPL